ncbi:MAG: hypothetical protein HYV28_15730 [Ignavibacteriales bacterium]|nr:hypothetical protein [Ignavibacteriales bacterium]
MNRLINKVFIILAASLLLSLVHVAYAEDKDKDKKVEKISTNDVQDQISINQIRMMFYNNGIGSYNRAGSSSGLYWPGGDQAYQTAIFQDGLLIGAVVGTEIRVGGSAYRTGLQAGKILPNGKADLAINPKYRIYKIRKGWEKLEPGELKSRLEKDYNEWPMDDGAPYVDVDTNGKYSPGIDKPFFIGDEVDWFVANDMDASRTTFLYGTQPMGLEIQNTIFGFKKDGSLGDMVFKKYVIINKGNKNLKDVYLCQWSDPDLGDAGDDWVGCDTLLKIGYTYNGDGDDAGANGYGRKPPAVAYVFFQGPMIPYDKVAYPIITAKGLPDSAKFNWKWYKNKTNIPMTSFSFFINGSSIYTDPVQGKPEGSTQFYNYMTSKLWNGNLFMDPTVTPPVAANYCLSGDPVNGTGWTEKKGGLAPGDRRINLSAGPFNMNPGDTQEVVIGIVLAQGADNLNSVKVLKDVVQSAQAAYDINFELIPNITSPKVFSIPEDKKIILYWDKESEVEGYSKVDQLIVGDSLMDKTFRFEGYEVYQYKDAKGTNPQLIATYDSNNTLGEIWDPVKINGYKVNYPVVFGTNSGIKRIIEISTDKLTGRSLHNGSPYYFGVVAYAYNANATVKVMKSVPEIFAVQPQSMTVGDQYPVKFGQSFSISKSENNDGIVNTFVVDPTKLTGDKYEVSFFGTGTAMRWKLTNVTKNIVLLDSLQCDTVVTDVDYLLDAKMVDGFIVKVVNPGLLFRKVKELVMVKDAGIPVNGVGNVVAGVPREGINVFGASSISSSRGWWIDVFDSTLIATEGRWENASMGLQGLNYKRGIGSSDIEIRFEAADSNYSQFYPFSKIVGLAGRLLSPSSLVGKNKIPLSVWAINDPSTPADDKRMYLKAFDGKLTYNLDSSWGWNWYDEIRLEHNRLAYEEIVAFPPLNNANYVSPIPSSIGTTLETNYRTRFTIFANASEQFPKPGTVLKVSQWKGIQNTAKYTFTAEKPLINNKEVAKADINNISVYPNPYYGAHSIELDKYQRFVRFTNLPPTCTIRIYSLGGVLIRRIERQGAISQFEDWDLLNKDAVPVASGMFIAYIDIPGVGSKILKLAIIQETPYIDRL